MKECTGCHQLLSTDNFYTKKYHGKTKTSIYLKPQCKPCNNKASGITYRKNLVRHRARIREAKLRTKYGINQKIYDSMLSEQGGVCAICGNPETSRRMSLAVDHCHDTGLVRGLLCLKCNRGIGCFEDNIELLSRAVWYMERCRDPVAV